MRGRLEKRSTFGWVSGRGVSSDGLARVLRHARCDRNPHADLGAFVRFGHDTKSSLRKPDALAHAHEAKASALPPRSGSIEPLAIVNDREFDAVAVADADGPQPGPHRACLTTLCSASWAIRYKAERRSPNPSRVDLPFGGVVDRNCVCLRDSGTVAGQGTPSIRRA